MRNYNQPHTEFHKCAWRDCWFDGEYPAPKSPTNLNEKVFFCKHHIREYNNSWDFFANMSTEQIERYHADSIAGHRHTRKMNVNEYLRTEDAIKQKLWGMSGKNNNKKQTPSIPKNEKDALDVLGIAAPTNWNIIRKKYKELVKKYHPDISNNTGEEKIKIINQAYSNLKKIYNP